MFAEPKSIKEPKIADGFGMKQLGFTYTNSSNREICQRYVEFKMNENEKNDK